MALQQRTSRIGTTENLPNHSTYELLLVTVDNGFPKGQIKFQFETTPRKITGIQKVAQMFIKVLFTQKGSDVINSNLGTNFPELAIGANRTTTDDQLFLSDIANCVRDAENQTRNITSSLNKDLESQLDKVIIQGLNTDRESLNMFIQVVTKAGEQASIAVPFPQLDLRLSNG